MGSYSVSCGLSGLEIAQGDNALVCILRQKGPPTDWAIAVPPLRGYYDDYGYLVIDDADRPLASAFGVDTTSREWTPLEHDLATDPLAKQPTSEYQWVLPMWVHSSAFDTLPELVRDYSSFRKDGTVGEDTEDHVAEVAKKLLSLEAVDPADPGPALEDGRTVRDLLNEISISQIIGYSPVIENFAERVNAAHKAGQPLDLLVEGYRRAFLLTIGAFELRRPLMGQNASVGPQHGGERAAARFARMVSEISEQRNCDRQDDDY